ncbi:hypothetical protein ACFWIA_09250 [Streptomyces sp. NPDC127068]|uniref:hypothetical protein n=1 Tax=Streptomyces sp. NPDC127068 TaxID=3347127 RepID=UPI003657C6BA
MPPASTEHVLAVDQDEAVRAAVRATADRVRATGVRVRMGGRAALPLGRRAVERELSSPPLCAESGPRDVGSGAGGRVRCLPGGEKPVTWDALTAVAPDILADDRALPLTQARERRLSRTADVTSVAAAVEAAVPGGWARIPGTAPGTEAEERPARHEVSVRCPIAGNGTFLRPRTCWGNPAVVARLSYIVAIPTHETPSTTRWHVPVPYVDRPKPIGRTGPPGVRRPAG